MKRYLLFYFTLVISVFATWFFLKPHVSKWQLMWLLATVIFFICKIWSLNFNGNNKVNLKNKLIYFFCWVGLDAKSFLQKSNIENKTGYLRVAFQLLVGVILFLVAQNLIPKNYIMIRAWVGMIGVVFALHFGFFLAVSIFWRNVGFNAKQLMNNPLASKSVSDFWGNRWNTAFRDFSYDNLFLPVFKLCKNFKLTKKISFYSGSFSVFFFSGLAHEAVISLPAGSGFGQPLLYFVIQYFGTIIERKNKLFQSKLINRVFVYCLVILPVPLLFHKPFINLVIIPFIDEFRF